MAAGLGYKEFTTGDVLTAADANGYLASQVVMVFADSAARAAAITSPQEGMITYLKDTNSTEYYSGSAYVAIGGTASGLTLITNQTVTSSTTVNVNNVFSATYDNYLVIGTLTSTAAQNGDIRLRVSGADNSTANSYVYEKITTDNTTISASKTTSDKWTGIVFAGPNVALQKLSFYRPFIAAQTGIDGLSSVEGNYLLLSGGLHNQSTSYTGFTLLYGSAVSGEIKVYGLAE